MNNNFLSYDLSLEMKGIGFDEPCFAWYVSEEYGLAYGQVFKSQLFRNAVLAPTFSQAFRFFREKHNLMFQIFYLRNGNYSVIIHKTTPEYMNLVDQIGPFSGCLDEVVDCYSYEEAELACLEKLIEIVEQQNQN